MYSSAGGVNYLIGCISQSSLHPCVSVIAQILPPLCCGSDSNSFTLALGEAPGWRDPLQCLPWAHYGSTRKGVYRLYTKVHGILLRKFYRIENDFEIIVKRRPVQIYCLFKICIKHWILLISKNPIALTHQPHLKISSVKWAKFKCSSNYDLKR